MGHPNKLTLVAAALLAVVLPMVYCATLPTPPNCGADRSPKLVTDVLNVDEFPWTALLQYRRANKTSFNCQGALISPRYVLTAAHCVNALPKDMELINVRLGEYDLTKETDCQDDNGYKYCSDSPVNVGVESIIMHEDYIPQTRNFHHDIALVRLSRDVESSMFIQPVCLPINDDTRLRNITGRWATEVGWFRTPTARLSDTKLKQVMKIVDPASCAAQYKLVGVDVQQEDQLCARPEHEKSGICGLGGASLMVQSDVDRSYFLYGLVSFGPSQCGRNGIPEVYTKIPKYVDWIQSKLE